MERLVFKGVNLIINNAKNFDRVDRIQGLHGAVKLSINATNS